MVGTPGAQSGTSTAGTVASTTPSGNIIGVASKNPGASLRTYNEHTHYNEWQFIALVQSTRGGGAGGAGAAGGQGAGRNGGTGPGAGGPGAGGRGGQGGPGGPGGQGGRGPQGGQPQGGGQGRGGTVQPQGR